MKKPLVIAHRGASGHAPENTLSAFQQAIEMKADGIEIDVHLSRDGNLIVCHDERVDRTTNGKGLIKDMTLKELKKLDAGSWFDERYRGEQVLTLDEVLEFLKEKNLFLNIELKNSIIPYEHLERKVIHLVRKYQMERDTIISSFNHYSLVKVKKIDSDIKTGILYMAGIIEPWEYAKKLRADAIHPHFYNIRHELIKGCRENNIMINTFTVNEVTEIMMVSKMGVSGIITNYPERARKILGKR